MTKADVFAQFDARVGEVDIESSPWRNGKYAPDLDLLVDLVSLPISAGDKQESGRPAKAFDAWIATELRRAGFPDMEVWPRRRQPRVLSGEFEQIEAGLDRLEAALELAEATGTKVSPPELRRAIKALRKTLPGTGSAYILGEFYAKQVDVVISSWRRGPEVLISTKTMFSSYKNNLKNRHEEAVGEVMSLRARHPMATIGFAFLAHKSIFEVDGAYAMLSDIVLRLRREGAAFDAALLLVADWNVDDPSQGVLDIDQPNEFLGASRFFEDVSECVCARSPIGEHLELRRRMLPEEPIGGLPDEGDMDIDGDPA